MRSVVFCRVGKPSSRAVTSAAGSARKSRGGGTGGKASADAPALPASATAKSKGVKKPAARTRPADDGGDRDGDEAMSAADAASAAEASSAGVAATSSKSGGGTEINAEHWDF